ncbi:MAG TPA: response regulator [Thermoanaerobaculia bacterium]|nr:response regulator [Thermoanaerobaculia bacterium]
MADAETRPVRAVVVDDSPFQCTALRLMLEKRYGERVRVETYVDPVQAVEKLDAGIGLLLLDWEMPGLDGGAMLEEARRRGVDLKRVIIRSGRHADELHRRFDGRGCLCVIEKGEKEQQAAFLMILDGIVRRASRSADAPAPA